MEDEEKGELVIMVTQGMFIVGTATGAGRLEKPRVLTILDKGKQMQLTPLPGIPGEIFAPRDTISYVIPAHDKGIKSLYERVTAKGVDPN